MSQLRSASAVRRAIQRPAAVQLRSAHTAAAAANSAAASPAAAQAAAAATAQASPVPTLTPEQKQLRDLHEARLVRRDSVARVLSATDVEVEPPRNAYRGGWVDTFRGTVLTQLLATINQQGSSAGWTYIDYTAGPDKWDISQSVRRQWGINPVFDYGRAMSVLRHRDERVFMGHPFLGLMRRVREVNSDVVEDAESKRDWRSYKLKNKDAAMSKLVPGFKYFPSTAAMLKPIMRPQDRAILCEKDPQYFHRLAAYVGTDPRFKLYNLDVLEEVALSEKMDGTGNQPKISIPQKLARGEKLLDTYHAVLRKHKEADKVAHEQKKVGDTTDPDAAKWAKEAEERLQKGEAPARPAHEAFLREQAAHSKHSQDILRFLGLAPPPKEAEPVVPERDLLNAVADQEAEQGAHFENAANPLDLAPPVPEYTARRADYATEEEYQLAAKIADLQTRVAAQEVDLYMRLQGVNTEALGMSVTEAAKLPPSEFRKHMEKAAMQASTAESRKRLERQRQIAQLRARIAVHESKGYWSLELAKAWTELQERIRELKLSYELPMHERVTDEMQTEHDKFEDEDEPLKSMERMSNEDPLEDVTDDRLVEIEEDLITAEPETQAMYHSLVAKIEQARATHEVRLQKMRVELETALEERRAEWAKLQAAKPLRLDEQLALGDLAVLRERVRKGDKSAVSAIVDQQRRHAFSLAKTAAEETAQNKMSKELSLTLGQSAPQIWHNLLKAEPKQLLAILPSHVDPAPIKALLRAAKEDGLSAAERTSREAKLQEALKAAVPRAFAEGDPTTFREWAEQERTPANPRLVAARETERRRFLELTAETQKFLEAKAAGTPAAELEEKLFPGRAEARSLARAQHDVSTTGAWLDSLSAWAERLSKNWAEQAKVFGTDAKNVRVMQDALAPFLESVSQRKQARAAVVSAIQSSGASSDAVSTARAEVSRLDTAGDAALKAFNNCVGAVYMDALAVVEGRIARALAELSKAEEPEEEIVQALEEIDTELKLKGDLFDHANDRALELHRRSDLPDVEDLREAIEEGGVGGEVAKKYLGVDAAAEDASDEVEDALEREEARMEGEDVDAQDEVEVALEKATIEAHALEAAQDPAKLKELVEDPEAPAGAKDAYDAVLKAQELVQRLGNKDATAKAAMEDARAKIAALEKAVEDEEDDTHTERHEREIERVYAEEAFFPVQFARTEELYSKNKQQREAFKQVQAILTEQGVLPRAGEATAIAARPAHPLLSFRSAPAASAPAASSAGALVKLDNQALQRYEAAYFELPEDFVSMRPSDQLALLRSVPKGKKIVEPFGEAQEAAATEGASGSSMTAKRAADLLHTMQLQMSVEDNLDDAPTAFALDNDLQSLITEDPTLAQQVMPLTLADLRRVDTENFLEDYGLTDDEAQVQILKQLLRDVEMSEDFDEEALPEEEQIDEEEDDAATIAEKQRRTARRRKLFEAAKAEYEVQKKKKAEELAAAHEFLAQQRQAAAAKEGETEAESDDPLNLRIKLHPKFMALSRSMAAELRKLDRAAEIAQASGAAQSSVVVPRKTPAELSNLSEEERAAYKEALEHEAESIRRFNAKVRALEEHLLRTAKQPPMIPADATAEERADIEKEHAKRVSAIEAEIKRTRSTGPTPARLPSEEIIEQFTEHQQLVKDLLDATRLRERFGEYEFRDLEDEYILASERLNHWEEADLLAEDEADEAGLDAPEAGGEDWMAEPTFEGPLMAEDLEEIMPPTEVDEEKGWIEPEDPDEEEELEEARMQAEIDEAEEELAVRRSPEEIDADEDLTEEEKAQEKAGGGRPVYERPPWEASEENPLAWPIDKHMWVVRQSLRTDPSFRFALRDYLIEEAAVEREEQGVGLGEREHELQELALDDLMDVAGINPIPSDATPAERVAIESLQAEVEKEAKLLESEAEGKGQERKGLLLPRDPVELMDLEDQIVEDGDVEALNALTRAQSAAAESEPSEKELALIEADAKEAQSKLIARRRALRAIEENGGDIDENADIEEDDIDDEHDDDLTDPDALTRAEKASLEYFQDNAADLEAEADQEAAIEALEAASDRVDENDDALVVDDDVDEEGRALEEVDEDEFLDAEEEAEAIAEEIEEDLDEEEADEEEEMEETLLEIEAALPAAKIAEIDAVIDLTEAAAKNPLNAKQEELWLQRYRERLQADINSMRAMEDEDIRIRREEALAPLMHQRAQQQDALDRVHQAQMKAKFELEDMEAQRGALSSLMEAVPVKPELRIPETERELNEQEKQERLLRQRFEMAQKLREIAELESEIKHDKSQIYQYDFDINLIHVHLPARRRIVELQEEVFRLNQEMSDDPWVKAELAKAKAAEARPEEQTVQWDQLAEKVGLAEMQQEALVAQNKLEQAKRLQGPLFVHDYEQWAKGEFEIVTKLQAIAQAQYDAQFYTETEAVALRFDADEKQAIAEMSSAQEFLDDVDIDLAKMRVEEALKALHRPADHIDEAIRMRRVEELDFETREKILGVLAPAPPKAGEPKRILGTMGEPLNMRQLENPEPRYERSAYPSATAWRAALADLARENFEKLRAEDPAQALSFLGPLANNLKATADVRASPEDLGISAQVAAAVSLGMRVGARRTEADLAAEEERRREEATLLGEKFDEAALAAERENDHRELLHSVRMLLGPQASDADVEAAAENFSLMSWESVAEMRERTPATRVIAPLEVIPFAIPAARIPDTFSELHALQVAHDSAKAKVDFVMHRMRLQLLSEDPEDELFSQEDKERMAEESEEAALYTVRDAKLREQQLLQMSPRALAALPGLSMDLVSCSSAPLSAEAAAAAQSALAAQLEAEAMAPPRVETVEDILERGEIAKARSQLTEDDLVIDLPEGAKSRPLTAERRAVLLEHRNELELELARLNHGLPPRDYPVETAILQRMMDLHEEIADASDDIDLMTKGLSDPDGIEADAEGVEEEDDFADLDRKDNEGESRLASAAQAVPDFDEALEGFSMEEHDEAEQAVALEKKFEREDALARGEKVSEEKEVDEDEDEDDLDALEDVPVFKSLRDRAIESLAPEDKAAYEAMKAREARVKEAVQGRVLTEEERAQLEYTRKVKRNEDILRRRLLEQSPEDFIAAQERLLQDALAQQQASLSPEQQAKRAQIVSEWRKKEEAQDADVMAKVAKDSTGAGLTLAQVELTMYRRRLQGLDVSALKPVQERLEKEDINSAYEEARAELAKSSLPDALPLRLAPTRPRTGASRSEMLAYETALADWRKQVANDRRLQALRQTSREAPIAFQIRQARKAERNPAEQRRRALLEAHDRAVLAPVRSKLDKLRAESTDGRVAPEALDALNAETVALSSELKLLEVPSLEDLRGELADAELRLRRMQVSRRSAQFVDPTKDIDGLKLAADEAKIQKAAEQQLAEEMVLAGELPPAPRDPAAEAEADLQARKDAAYKRAVEALHIPERLNEIGLDPAMRKVREAQLHVEAQKRAYLEVHGRLPDEVFVPIEYTDAQKLDLAEAARQDIAMGIIPPEGQPREVPSAATHFPVNLASAISRPLTAHAIVSIDVPEPVMEGFGVEGDIVAVDDAVLASTQSILDQSMHRFPHATYVITYPIYGRGYQDQLMAHCAKSGVRQILQATFHIQKGEPFDAATRVYDFEPWGTGVIVIRPPPGFDKVLRDIVNTLQDVMVGFGPSIHTLEEQDAVASRAFPPVDMQANATFFVDQSIHHKDGWPNRPNVSWMTPQIDEHIKNLHSFRWEHFVPSFENPRSKRFELLARARNDLESDLWNYSRGYRGDDETANRWLLLNNQQGRNANLGVRSTTQRSQREPRAAKFEIPDLFAKADPRLQQKRSELQGKLSAMSKRRRVIEHELQTLTRTSPLRLSDDEAAEEKRLLESRARQVAEDLEPLQNELEDRLKDIDEQLTEAEKPDARAELQAEFEGATAGLRKKQADIDERLAQLAARKSDRDYTAERSAKLRADGRNTRVSDEQAAARRHEVEQELAALNSELTAMDAELEKRLAPIDPADTTARKRVVEELHARSQKPRSKALRLRHQLDLLNRRPSDAAYYAALSNGTPHVVLAIDDTTAAELKAYESSRLAEVERSLQSSSLDAATRDSLLKRKLGAERKLADLELRAAEVKKHNATVERTTVLRRELQALRIEQRKQEAEVRRTLRTLEDQIEEEVRLRERTGFDHFSVQPQGAGRYGTMAEPPPVNQALLEPHERYTKSSEQPAIDSVHTGLVLAQQRAIKRLKDSELTAARDQKRRTVFELLGSFQQGKLSQQVQADAEAQAEFARIEAAKRAGTYVASAEEEQRRAEQEQRRRTLPLHVRMGRDVNFQQKLRSQGQHKRSQMVIRPKRQ